MSHKLRPILLLVILPLLLATIFIPGQARHTNGVIRQQDTAYPGPEGSITPYPYPGEGNPPTSAPTQTRPATQPAQTTPTGTSSIPITITLTTTTLPTINLSISPTITATPSTNTFATEDAEMQNARVTPPSSETPAPTDTLTPTITPSATPTIVQAFDFNQTWFIAGIVAPIALLIIAFLIRRAMASGEFSGK